MNNDFFFTWTKQNDAKSFKVKEIHRDFYLLEDETKLYDLTSCSYHQCLGLKNDELALILSEQLKSWPLSGPKFDFKLKNKASKKLKSLLGKKDGKLFYTTSGSETVENALKFARLYTGKEIILSRKLSYHGATTGALTMTGDWRRDDHKKTEDSHSFIPGPEDSDYKIKLEKIINEHKGNIAAIILETITGGNGVLIPPQEYYDEISKVCNENDILLILDEVVCGFGRTGQNFGFQNYKINPDIICMAKGISAGFIPFGALWVNGEISEYFNKNTLSMGLTNYAHPLGLRALDFMCDYLENRENQKRISELINLLKRYSNKFSQISSVKEVRQIGLLMAIELSHIPKSTDFYNKGLYLVTNKNNVILCPHFEYDSQTLKKLLEEVLDVIKEYSNEK